MSEQNEAREYLAGLVAHIRRNYSSDDLLTNTLYLLDDVCDFLGEPKIEREEDADE